MYRRKFFLTMGAASLIATSSRAWAAAPSADPQAERQFAKAMKALERSVGGRLGVSLLNTMTGQALGWRQDERFPMCSTFKMLLAGQVLSRVDAGQEKLDAQVTFGRSALVEYSPVIEKFAGKAPMSVEALCHAIVTISDNGATNLLLERVGGPAGFTAYVRSLNDPTTRLDRIEPDMSESKPGDVRDTTSPLAMLTSMHALTLGKTLSPASREKLLGWMLANTTGDHCLRAGAPGWKVADKTGSGPGTRNDIGLLWAPGAASPILVTSYLTESKAAPKARDAALASVAAEVVKLWG
ncbi:class A beta-lactamase [Comamonas sp. JUb58]|uniref:class A beta-lactamase n=1 Tax=Comamonas sp. JUb58 TaxID=2485114 RepID=UPI00105EAB4E|nr:class A beta-lactamase [Comamonas sp. JUb58]TDS78159.1 beta-lactamase class A [Comamonas sp. JUb58]